MRRLRGHDRATIHVRYRSNRAATRCSVLRRISFRR